jgi:acyl-CoA thioester hydrolase
MNKNRFSVRIYWEDTDAGGIVYYANYLKFAERARTEALRSLGVEQQRLREEHGILMVVARCEIDYKRSAKLDDLLTVETRLQELSKLRMRMHQCIRRDTEILAEIMVFLACVNTAGKLTPWPESLSASLLTLLDQE